MFIDPEAGLPLQDVLAIVWKRDPALYQRVLAVSEHSGRSVEDIVLEARAAAEAFFAVESPERDAFYVQEFRRRYPFGLDPLLDVEEEEEA